jgi:quinoprotein glucose dehydrogenase
MNIRRPASPANIGVMITKTMVVLGDPQFTNIPEKGGRGASLRHNKMTGEQIGEVRLPAPVVGHPMTYRTTAVTSSSA